MRQGRNDMRYIAAILLCMAGPALAQAPAAPPATPPADPVVATVEGEPVRLSEVLAGAAEVLPPDLRNVPPDLLMTMLPPPVMQQLVDRAINDRAIIIVARRLGIDSDPEIRARIERAERQEITQALLRREVLPRLTDEAVRARYDREYANRPAEEEVRARHILVPTEAEARTLLAELARGTAFEEVSRRAGTGAGQREAGDLGWFKRGDMVPEFANAAFAMQAGQTSTAPVRTQFGWHIIRVEERRSSSGPSFDESRETIREQLVQDEVNAALTRIRGQVNVQVMAPAAPPAPALLQGAQPPAPPPAPSPARR
jgi:peptidyl-prolyl cis-trans isomerase C